MSCDVPELYLLILRLLNYEKFGRDADTKPNLIHKGFKIFKLPLQVFHFATEYFQVLYGFFQIFFASPSRKVLARTWEIDFELGPLNFSPSPRKRYLFSDFQATFLLRWFIDHEMVRILSSRLQYAFLARKGRVPAFGLFQPYFTLFMSPELHVLMNGMPRRRKKERRRGASFCFRKSSPIVLLLLIRTRVCVFFIALQTWWKFLFILCSDKSSRNL